MKIGLEEVRKSSPIITKNPKFEVLSKITKTEVIPLFRFKKNIEEPTCLVLPFELKIGASHQLTHKININTSTEIDLFENRAELLGIGAKQDGSRALYWSKRDLESVKIVHTLTAMFIPNDTKRAFQDQTEVHSELDYYLTVAKGIRNIWHEYEIFVSLKPSSFKSWTQLFDCPSSRDFSLSRKICCFYRKQTREAKKIQVSLNKSIFLRKEMNMHVFLRFSHSVSGWFSYLDILVVQKIIYLKKNVPKVKKNKWGVLKRKMGSNEMRIPANANQKCVELNHVVLSEGVAFEKTMTQPKGLLNIKNTTTLLYKLNFSKHQILPVSHKTQEIDISYSVQLFLSEEKLKFQHKLGEFPIKIIDSMKCKLDISALRV